MISKKEKYFWTEDEYNSSPKKTPPRHFSWVEESFYFSQKTGRQVTINGSREHTGSSFTVRNANFLLVFLVVVFSLIIFRLFFLQIIRGEHYLLAAENNRQRIIPIPAERGLFYDRNDISLTKNIPNFSLAVIPQDLPKDRVEREKIIKKLSLLTGQDEQKIRALLEEYGSYSYESIVIQDNITYDSALSILIDYADLPGIQIQRSSKRLYLSGQGEENFTTSSPRSFSHILGYIGKLNPDEFKNLYQNGYLPSDNIGKSGVEKSYENILRGVYGRRRIEVNAAGKEQSVIAEEAPLAGSHVKLTIDSKIQDSLEKIIVKNLEVSQKKRAAGIVMDPNSGEILAMVSLPTYDNNDFSGGIDSETYKKYLDNNDRPLFNRAISGIYPSGSSIKPAIAAGALQEGIINVATSFLSTGGIQVGPWFFPDWLAGGHGLTDVRKSLAWSVNTFYYYIGGGYDDFVGLGVDKINYYLQKFGFSQKTGIDLSGEQPGFLPSRDWKLKTKNERWYVGDTYNMSIGQGDILVTPLQIANMTASIANGGTLYKPRIVKSTIDSATTEEYSFQTEIIKTDFIDKANVNTIRLGMKDCVDYGSCRRLSYLPFAVAGKTGTAQWNKEKANHAWFTSFAPFDKPEVVVTILVEEGGEGSGIGAQIAYDFYKWWGHYRQNSKLR